jgi:AraC-type DNA-binding domain-containing proteins
MLYNSAYIVAENNDKGFESKEEYMIINAVGHFEFSRKWSSRHRNSGRADYLMMYVHSGEMKVRLSGNDAVIKAGTVVLYRPGQEQLYRHNDECPVKCYWAHFTGYGVELLLKSLDFGEEGVFNIGINNEIPSLVKIMINDIHTRNVGYKTIAVSLFMQVLTIISRKSLRNVNKEYKKAVDDIISLSLDYIHINYMKDIAVSELSQMNMLSTNRYIKVFKRELGVTPREYIIRLRLEKACELLGGTNFNIKQISSMVGMENQMYFSRLFKKYLGMTPSTYKIKE